MTPSDEQEPIEAQLRATAPLLPPELRQQVLRRCQHERRAAPLRIWDRRWKLAGAFATFVLFCSMASGNLDTQNQAMINGDTGQSNANAITRQPQNASNADFVLAFRWRIHQLALLLHDKHSG